MTDMEIVVLVAVGVVLMNVPLDCLGGMVLLIVLFVILAGPR